MIKINNRIISEKTKPYIIAELSANHNGSFKNAKNLIKKIAKSGVDAVKLQTFLPEEMTLKSKKKDFIHELYLKTVKNENFIKNEIFIKFILFFIKILIFHKDSQYKD